MEHATDRGSRKTLQSTVHEKSDFLKFHGKLKLVDGLAIKFNEFFFAGANFIASRRRANQLHDS